MTRVIFYLHFGNLVYFLGGLGDFWGVGGWGEADFLGGKGGGLSFLRLRNISPSSLIKGKSVSSKCHTTKKRHILVGNIIEMKRSNFRVSIDTVLGQI